MNEILSLRRTPCPRTTSEMDERVGSLLGLHLMAEQAIVID